MGRTSMALSAALVAVLALVVGDAAGSTAARHELTLRMDDGAAIAMTLHLPEGGQPSAGWPAIVVLHAVGGNREQMNALVAATGFAAQGYAVLTYDARGHGQSGGLAGIAGPRDVADARAVFQWLADRPDVDGNNIGALGISYGGGIALNSLVGGVPWAAVFAAQTWTDLFTALMPQGLAKSGVVAGLAASIPESRRDPSVSQAYAAALAGDVAAVRPWAAERSSVSRLGAVTTPVFIAQGRRDFTFGLDQGIQAFRLLKGPKVLYAGLHGHWPSTFPAADTGALVSLARDFFECWLRSALCDPPAASVYLASETFTGTVARRGSTLPPTAPRVVAFPGVSTFANNGKAVRTATLTRDIEVFGTPTVKTSVAASGGWSRVVGVLTARTPQRREIVVAAGGVPTRSGVQRLTIALSSQATFVPRGSRLTLTIASSSLAQSPSTRLYLDPPVSRTARLRVGNAVLTLPGLRTPVTR